jgi:hypothetical protein
MEKRVDLAVVRRMRRLVKGLGFGVEDGMGPRLARDERSRLRARSFAKSLISTHIEHGRAVSPLFAHTSQNRGEGGYDIL